ncbi:hypothetical protein RGQ29_032958 [Quercus rubra]|uniref:Uncharacterized protein n=1 Tax=Quercus rubra TaxID=3512 RepID=A0AAN7HYT0_QUERU|nr:hypothetical protein RGQ29_032958 [Quercus rubra]
MCSRSALFRPIYLKTTRITAVSAVSASASASANDSNNSLQDYGSSTTLPLLLNTNQFYKWFTDLESAMKSETEEKYQHYVSTLTERIQTCDGILRQVDDTLDYFNELQLQHQAVATRLKLFMMRVTGWW